jgi:hypothetical protein
VSNPFHRTLRQTATYWAPGVTDAYGHPDFAAPVQIACRWEDGMETVTTRTGEEVQSTSIVDLASAVVTDGYLALGTFAEADPGTVDAARQIIRVDRIPALRTNAMEYTAYL